MDGSAAPQHGDYALKGKDIRQYYAAWGRRALPDDAIMALSAASAALPENHIGFEAWIAMVAGDIGPARKVHAWALALGDTIAVMRPRIRTRSRTYCEGYSATWGRQAAIDGAAIAIIGLPPASLRDRAQQFGVSRETYLKIRAFVEGAVKLQASQFEGELLEVVRAKLASAKVDLLN